MKETLGMDETTSKYPKGGVNLAEEETIKIPGFMVFFDEFRAVLDELTDSETGRLFKAIFRYFESGEEPEPFQDRFLKAECSRLKTSIEKSNRAYLELKQKHSNGGKKRWNSSEAKTAELSREELSSTELSSAELTNTSTNTKTSTNTNTKTTTKTNTKSEGDTHAPRHSYGEYANVLLTDEDLAKLKKEFPRDWAALIEELSTAMESKGMHYKNHLATIRAWARKDGIQRVNGPEQPAEAKPKPKRRYAAGDMMQNPADPDGPWIPKPEAVAREDAREAAEAARNKAAEPAASAGGTAR